MCANVGARQLDGVKDTKLSVSLLKTSTKGVGAVLSFSGSSYVYISDSTGASAAGGHSGPAATGYGSHYSDISGYVDADAATSSDGGGQAGAGAAASPSGAVGNGTDSGGGSWEWQHRRLSVSL